MRLFVWADPYPVRYGSSMVIAVAETLEDAKLAARNGKAYSFVKFDQDAGGVATLELGEPTRVVDVPCAEWHKWSE